MILFKPCLYLCGVLLSSNWQGSFASQLHLGKPGQPKIMQIRFLRELKFSWKSIANIVGVSRTTLFERRRELQLDDNFLFISDEQLTCIIKVVKDELPNIGERVILNSRIINVLRRVRETIHRVDLINVSLCWSEKLYRCQYSVPGPNSLWHLGKVYDLF